MTSASLDWSSIQLSDFLAEVSSAQEEGRAYALAVERVAMAMEAEVATITAAGKVLASVGFRRGRVPVDALLSVVASERELDLPGIGRCQVTAAELPGSDGALLLVARRDIEFSVAERLLLRNMAQVLQLAVLPLRQLEVERRLRREGERRQLFLEHLIRVQREIARRANTKAVFDEVAEAVRATVGDEIVVTRLLSDSGTEVMSSVGLSPELVAASKGFPTGVSGRAISLGQLVSAEDYPALPEHRADIADNGIRSAMAAPLRRDGEVAGALVVATRQPRTYDRQDHVALLAFAEQLSIALNEESADEQKRRAYRHAVHRADHDALTELPNRRLATSTLEAAIAGHAEVAVMFVDIDRFKQVNDTWGHDVGDRLLREVAAELMASSHDGDTICRLSGDEFLVISPGSTLSAATTRAQVLCGAIAHSRSINDRQVVVTASIGVTIAVPGMSAESVVRDADVAMYRAKQRGRGVVQVFDSAMRVELLARSETEQALRKAVDGGQLRLEYQPILNLWDDTLHSLEALVRWERPGVGLVPPGGFLDIAEETGQMPALGLWVLRQAVEDFAAIRSRPGAARVSLNVNVSARQLSVEGFAAQVLATIAEADLPADAVRLELTETVLMADDDTVEAALRQLTAAGVKVSIDDFGTGYSSLLYLQRFQVSELKIDRRFVAGLGHSAQDLTIVRSIIELGSNLGMEIVAEGVETKHQLRELIDLGATHAQGFLLGRPGPVEELLEHRRPSAALGAEPADRVAAG